MNAKALTAITKAQIMAFGYMAENQHQLANGNGVSYGVEHFYELVRVMEEEVKLADEGKP